VPAGAKVVPGSSRLGDRPLPDPTRSARGVLYWTVPLRDLPAGASELSYQVTHTQALAALPDAALSLRGDSGTLRLVGNLDPGDYGLASALPVDGAENPGSVKLPLDGSQLRQTNQFTLVVETDPASTELPRVNGVPVSAAQLGHVRPSADGQRERRSYYALPVHPGKNLIEFGREQVRQVTQIQVRAGLKDQHHRKPGRSIHRTYPPPLAGPDVRLIGSAAGGAFPIAFAATGRLGGDRIIKLFDVEIALKGEGGPLGEVRHGGRGVGHEGDPNCFWDRCPHLLRPAIRRVGPPATHLLPQSYPQEAGSYPQPSSTGQHQG